MIVWFFISLFFLWSFSPQACILFILSGVLLALSRHWPKNNNREKQD